VEVSALIAELDVLLVLTEMNAQVACLEIWLGLIVVMKGAIIALLLDVWDATMDTI
jgi:hypothetical protein